MRNCQIVCCAVFPRTATSNRHDQNVYHEDSRIAWVNLFVKRDRNKSVNYYKGAKQILFLEFEVTYFYYGKPSMRS